VSPVSDAILVGQRPRERAAEYEVLARRKRIERLVSADEPGGGSSDELCT